MILCSIDSFNCPLLLLLVAKKYKYSTQAFAKDILLFHALEEINTYSIIPLT